MNFIPEKSVENGDYFCSWGLQGDVATGEHLTGSNNWHLRDAVQDKYLFGEKKDYYHKLPMEDRSGLYYVIDDGWDVPLGKDYVPGSRPFGAIDPHPDRFPGYGDTPVERLKTLNAKVLELGYCGTGLWISCEEAYEPDGKTLEEAREYWAERARWCQEAGIRYWKIDWGRHAGDPKYRAMMTEVLREYAPDIQVEHPYNAVSYRDMDRMPMVRKKNKDMIEVSDYFRLMDIMPTFWYSTGPERAHEVLMADAEPKYNTLGMINGEDCYIMAAAMGFTTGVLYPVEETRVPLIWHRVAPPFSRYESTYTYSEETVTDTMFFDDPKDWRFNNMFEIVHPAIMARGCELPEVKPCDNIVPTVTCSRNPRTDVSSIAIQPRLIDLSGSRIHAKADITFKVTDPKTLVGVFGFYNTMTLVYNTEIPSDAHVFMQNIYDKEAQDITEEVTIKGNKLILTGTTQRILWKKSSESKGLISQMFSIQ